MIIPTGIISNNKFANYGNQVLKMNTKALRH